MERLVREAFERCQVRYPGIQLSLEAFHARVSEILASDMPPGGEETRNQLLSKIHHEGLYLAMACADGDRVAWEHFADEYLPLVQRFAKQACGNTGESEDLSQELTTKLLADRKRFAGYNGRGSLAGWLRVAVSHAAVDRFRRMSRQISVGSLDEEDLPAAPAAAEQQDDEAVDSRWGPVISRIVGECLSGLAARDRLLLCLYYLRGVPLKDIGRHFGIHEATASRWLDRMRRDMRKQVERELKRKHGMRSSEIQALWRWVSPTSFAESLAGSSAEAATSGSGDEFRKKSAMGEHSGVIDKEELR